MAHRTRTFAEKLAGESQMLRDPVDNGPRHDGFAPAVIVTPDIQDLNVDMVTAGQSNFLGRVNLGRLVNTSDKQRLTRNRRGQIDDIGAMVEEFNIGRGRYDVPPAGNEHQLVTVTVRYETPGSCGDLVVAISCHEPIFRHQLHDLAATAMRRQQNQSWRIGDFHHMTDRQHASIRVTDDEWGGEVSLIHPVARQVIVFDGLADRLISATFEVSTVAI